LNHCAWDATHDKGVALTLQDNLAHQKVVIQLSNSNFQSCLHLSYESMPMSLLRRYWMLSNGTVV
jgi:hypothetical protein